MIIACPACATRYAVPDSAIGVEGRTVRCAKCRHSWFQDGPELVQPVAPARAEGTPADSPAEEAQASAPAAMAREAGIPSDTPVEPVAAPDGVADDPPPPVERPPEPEAVAVANSFEEDEAVSPFDREPPFRPRRNWLRWFTWGAGAFAALALAAVVAMSTFGLPSWLPIEKPLFGADPGLKVEFPASEQERRTLPNGAEFFGARVVVRNEARESRNVPPLLIVLRDSRERVVYSWELDPPQSTLAPGEAMTINEAMTDVPKSAVYADIGWAPR
ncbi:MAG: zinc-ribbon domain-containing protein [Altererythrobacter sp.]|nr:zinc-ribbon domain-containing protein [Altererythrobacter sp.]